MAARRSLNMLNPVPIDPAILAVTITIANSFSFTSFMAKVFNCLELYEKYPLR